MKLFLSRPLLSVLCLSTVLSGCDMDSLKSWFNQEKATPETTSKAIVSYSGSLPDFSAIVDDQGAAVVNISVVAAQAENPNTWPQLPGLSPDDPIYEFFRRFQPPAEPEAPQARGLGSGFIVREDGVVLTNAHVVADASEVIVRLTDQREFKAKVLGVDKLTDVAVLKVDAKNLPTVKIGDPTKAKVGEWVVAIGSPFGFDNSVTAGIISAKSRSLPNEGYVPFLQTDVAINPGNSGGPLFNLKGEVIGINSQIYSRSGGYQGLSFSIPIDVAMNVEKQLVQNGKVSRGKLGILIQEMDADLAKSFALESNKGALISSVEPSSPAEKAGLMPGDVILKFNQQEIKRSTELPPLVANVAPGNHVNVELWRKGKLLTLQVVIGEMSPDIGTNEPSGQSDNKLGIQVRPLTPQERQQAGINEQAGLIIVNISDGPAARAGLQPGDIILAVQGEIISDANSLAKQLKQSGKRLACLIQRGEVRQYIAIRMD